MERILTALEICVTSQVPPQPHPIDPEPAIPLHCFIRVVRARRVVATRWRQDLRECHLITADHCQQDGRHEFNFASLSAACCMSSFKSANGTSSAAGRAIRTTSYRIPTPLSGESGPS